MWNKKFLNDVEANPKQAQTKLQKLTEKTETVKVFPNGLKRVRYTDSSGLILAELTEA